MNATHRNGFSLEQLQGFDLETYMPEYLRAKKAPVSEPESNGAKTRDRDSQKISAVEKTKALFKDTETNGYLREEQHPPATAARSHSPQGDYVVPIAIVGMSCRFPGGVSNLEEFWDLASEGRSAWSKVPESRFNVDAFYNQNSDRTDTVSPERYLARTSG